MKNNTNKIQVAIADNEPLFTRGLAALVNETADFEAVVTALNGVELINKLRTQPVAPDIALLDINMPEMNGIETAANLTKEFPQIRLVALSGNDDDITIIRTLRAGCCSYLLKDIIDLAELEKALKEIHAHGYYNADAANINYRRLLLTEKKMQEAEKLTDKEKQFLKLACSDLTYKQIAAKLYLSERTIDGYRESVFRKMNVQSRVGMALEAIRMKIVEL